MRRTLLALALFTIGCGSSPSSPTPIQPANFSSAAAGARISVDRTGPPPAPLGLPAATPNISGSWEGVLSTTTNGAHDSSSIGAVVTQSGRDVVVAWRTLPSGATSGRVTGTIDGVGSEATLTARVTMDAPSSPRGTRCHAEGAISGQAFPLWVYWTSPGIAVESTCGGVITYFRITLAR